MDLPLDAENLLRKERMRVLPKTECMTGLRNTMQLSRPLQIQMERS
jgi:hypothetical protein